MLIEQIIDDFLVKNNKRKDYKAKSFWVSSAGSCYRKRYLQRTNVKASNPFPKATLRKFHVGCIFHEMIQNLIKDKAKYFDIEKYVKDKHKSGYIDLIAKFNGKTTLYEIKSVSDFYFKYLEKERYGCNKNHLAQALTYYLMLNEKPDEIRIVYVGTSTLRLKECPVPINKKSLKWAEDDWKICIDYYKKKKLPPKTENKNECSYCVYRKYCKGLKNAEKK